MYYYFGDLCLHRRGKNILFLDWTEKWRNHLYQIDGHVLLTANYCLQIGVCQTFSDKIGTGHLEDGLFSSRRIGRGVLGGYYVATLVNLAIGKDV